MGNSDVNNKVATASKLGIPQDEVEFFKKMADASGKALLEARDEMARLKEDLEKEKQRSNAYAQQLRSSGNTRRRDPQRPEAEAEAKKAEKTNRLPFERYYNKKMAEVSPNLLSAQDFEEFKEHFGNIKGIDSIIRVEKFRLITEDGISVTTSLDIDPTDEEIYVSISSPRGAVSKTDYRFYCSILGKGDDLKKVKSVFAILEIRDSVAREVKLL